MRSYLSVVAAIASLLGVWFVVSCAAPPIPPPRPPPVPVAEIPVTPPALRTAYVEASNRLRIYLAQPLCAPSGAVACRDPVEATDALAAKRNAWSALDGLRNATVSVRLAKTRVEVFATIAGNLPIGEKTQ